jgi:exosortase K
VIRSSWLHVLGPLLAWALKRFYSHAAADDLAWILAPTCWLVERLTGFDFEREPYAGWISPEARTIVGPSCAGVNFLIIAFVTLFHSFVDRRATWREKWLWLFTSAGSAYALAISTNAVRIAAAIALRDRTVWIAPERAHLLLGTLIYLLALWLVHAVVGRLVPPRCVPGRGARLVPFAWYALIALGVPLANGAWRSTAFWRYASLVLLVVLAVALVVSAPRPDPAVRSRR